MPNKSGAPSEKVKQASGDLYDTKNPMFTNIDTVYQKGKSKQNVVEEANISPISEKRRLT